jgi:hypothetical protein
MRGFFPFGSLCSLRVRMTAISNRRNVLSAGVGGVEDGVLVVLHADEEFAEERGEGERDEGNRDGGDGGPEEEGVPLPVPELAGEVEWALAGGAKEFVGGERHGR